MKKRVFAVGTATLSAFAILFLTAILFSSPPRLQPAKPDVIVECLTSSLVPYADMWKTEAARRFTNVVVIECHGGDFVQGQWVVGAGWTAWKHVTPITEVIERYRVLYPGRELVLVSCNPGHIALHGYPHVWYAHSDIWIVPDRQMSKEDMESGLAMRTLNSGFVFNTLVEKPRSELEPDIVGSIFEFIEAK